MTIRAATGGIILFLTIAAAGTHGASLKGNSMEQSIRKPAVAGQFYPSDPEALRKEVEEFIRNAEPHTVSGDIITLISPHAGYMYSGHVAAAGYALLEKGQFETVVVISPCHVEYFRFASIFDGDAYETPLGLVEVDKELSKEIASLSDAVKIAPDGHGIGQNGRGEHSLEVQIPFLQVALGDFKIVPIVMGDQSASVVDGLGIALAGALAGRNVLIVASTDLSHFHDDGTARNLDGEFIEKLEAFDINGLKESISSGKTEACGGGPSAAAMIAASGLGGAECTILKYANSGDISGDRSNVVGYVSAVLSGDRSDNSSHADNPSHTDNPSHADYPSHDDGSIGEDVDRDTRIFLLRHARSVIRDHLGMDNTAFDRPASPILDEKRGGFVTLKINGRLRGCIGYIEAVKPLLETVTEMAYSAAFSDYRFEPLAKEEVDVLAIEISVLSPVRVIEDPSEIVVGKHGIILSAVGKRGLLLPQVAVEYGWDRDTFLDQTCIKAGLPKGAWRKSMTTIEIFSAEIFSEEELGLR